MGPATFDVVEPLKVLLKVRYNQFVAPDGHFVPTPRLLKIRYNQFVAPDGHSSTGVGMEKGGDIGNDTGADCMATADISMDTMETTNMGDVGGLTDTGMQPRRQSTSSTLTLDTWWSVSRCDSELRAESAVSSESNESALGTSSLQDRIDDEETVISEDIATDDQLLEGSWVLLDDLSGNVLAIPAEPRALTDSSTVESEWLTDVSSVAVSCTSTICSTYVGASPKQHSATTFADLCAPSQSPKRMAKVVSWAHPWRQTGAPTGDSPGASHMHMSDIIPTRRALHRSVALLRALSYCELQLIQLEQHDPDCESLLELQRGAACMKLCSELVALAAEALECGFDRNVPGAMEIFEHTNAAVERLAGLLGVEKEKETTSSAVWCRQSTESGCGCLDWIKFYIMA